MAMLSRIITRGFQTSRALRSSHGGDPVQAMKLWEKLSYFVAFPSIGLAMVNSYISHTAHHEERPPFIPYDFLRIRVKKYPWGDGNHTLFHNPEVNALPEGYET